MQGSAPGSMEASSAKLPGNADRSLMKKLKSFDGLAMSIGNGIADSAEQKKSQRSVELWHLQLQIVLPLWILLVFFFYLYIIYKRRPTIWSVRTPSHWPSSGLFLYSFHFMSVVLYCRLY